MRVLLLSALGCGICAAEPNEMDAVGLVQQTHAVKHEMTMVNGVGEVDDLSNEFDDDNARTAFLNAVAHHWQWVIDEEVLPEGDKVACDVLPTEVLNYLNEPSTGKYCSTDPNVWKVPSHRDAQFYFRFVEAPCTNSVPGLEAGMIAAYFYQNPALPLADVDAWGDFDWDKLALFEQKHASQLQIMADSCQALFGAGPVLSQFKESKSDFYYDYYSDGPRLLQQRRTRQEDLVTHIRWLTAAVDHPMAKAVGYVHSFLDVEASGKHFRMDVWPSDLGIAAGAKSVKPDSWRENNVHAEVKQEQLRSQLKVSDVLDALRLHESKKFNLLSKNCHHMIKETVGWAAPAADLPESPNSKWETLHGKVDAVFPGMNDMWLELGGASRTMCANQGKQIHRWIFGGGIGRL